MSARGQLSPAAATMAWAPGTSWLVRARDTWLVQRKSMWAVRMVGLAAVGLAALTSPPTRGRDVIADTVAFAVALVTIALWTTTERSPAAESRLARVMPVALAAMTASCGLAALGSTGGPFIFLATMATVSAGETYSLVPSCAITGVAALAVGSVGAAFQVSTFDLLGYPVILVSGLLIGRLLRDYRAQVEQSAVLLAQAEQLRQAQSRSAALDERNRIAREIHDVLAHSLGALGVQIQAAQTVLTDQGDVARAVEMLGQARRLASEGLTETRRALQALRADTPALPDGLAELMAVHHERYRVPVSFEMTGTPRSLTPDARLALTRTAQEALVNTAKHAPREPVAVGLEFTEGRTVLMITNLLCREATRHVGALETANGGFGLNGMHERLRLLDGSLSARPEGDRWVVRAEVPQ